MSGIPLSDANSNEETLKELLQNRIAQLEGKEEDPQRSPEEQAAEDAFQEACTAARAVITDDEIDPAQKLQELQSMFTECINKVRVLEYDLGLEEKRLSIAELDYSEIGEDLRKVDELTDKLKALSRGLSKQNKDMTVDSQKRTAEERGKREEIVVKFDETMKDINARLHNDDSVDDEKNEFVSNLEAYLEALQAQYEEREKYYDEVLQRAVDEEREETKIVVELEEALELDRQALVLERRALVNLQTQSRLIVENLAALSRRRQDISGIAAERQAALKRQSVDIERLIRSEADLSKEMVRLSHETTDLREKVRMAMDGVKAGEEELELFKAKAKGECEKRETFERLCRTLTEERTATRRKVQAMKAAWGLLNQEIENLRLEINTLE